MIIQKNITMAGFTNWRVGGTADLFVEVMTKVALISAIAEARNRNIPFLVLGGGTNVLISDSGFRGMVIKNKMNDIAIVSNDTRTLVRSDAGVLVNRLVRFTCDHALSGLENFFGQPGTVGGAIYINAHNMHQHDFFGDHIVEAELLLHDGTIKVMPQSYFSFEYDESVLQESNEVVISVIIACKQQQNQKDANWKKAEAAMKYRQTTQPKGYPTAGCTFRNISHNDAQQIGTPNQTRSAGYLIDSCGLKGKTIGHATISDQHANFILNMGGATASDIKALIDVAKKSVQEKFNVILKEEVVLVGF